MSKKNIVLDASAWIEYIRGSKKGQKVKDVLEKKQGIMNPLNIMEVCVYARKHGINDEIILRELLHINHEAEFDAKLALHAARLYSISRNKQSKLSYIDAAALVTADSLGCQLLTCDNDFAGMKSAIVIR